MDGVNQTLYIPLYGKSYVSKKGLFLQDKKAEEIWVAEGFVLKGKSKSKWLAYYMGIRAAVFDAWVRKQLHCTPDAVILHIGCGMDNRVLRVGAGTHKWYDVDFPEVIAERRRYFQETASYRLLPGDARDCGWLSGIPETGSAIVVMEGVSMYLAPQELRHLVERLCGHFQQVALLMDCYTVRAAKLSKYKNPINDVGVTQVYGIDEPERLECGGLAFVREHDMTPQQYIKELTGMEKYVFKKLYAGGFARKLYRLFEYRKSERMG